MGPDDDIQDVRSEGGTGSGLAYLLLSFRSYFLLCWEWENLWAVHNTRVNHIQVSYLAKQDKYLNHGAVHVFKIVCFTYCNFLRIYHCLHSCYMYLTPWSRVLLEKLTGRQVVKKFHAFYGTRRFIAALTMARHLSPPSRRYCWYSFLLEANHSAAGMIKSMKIPHDAIGNRTSDFPVCSAVSKPTAPPRTPGVIISISKFLQWAFHLTLARSIHKAFNVFLTPNTGKENAVFLVLHKSPT
jgi:hypothetical protein